MDLNPEQKRAAEMARGPLLIVAGAGTGKTRTLTSRLAYFIEQGVPAHKICAITFTNKAANEMASRVAATTDNRQLTTDNKENKGGWSSVRGQMSNVGTPFIGTFHSLGARILRSEGRLLGRKSNFAIFDSHDSFDLIKKASKKLVHSAHDASSMRMTRIERGRKQEKESPVFFAQKISEIKNKSGALEMLKKSQNQKDILTVKVFEQYERALEENNAFDFDDLIEKLVSLFKKHPEVLKKYQKGFDAVLVDEYQDVSPMQYEFVKLLAHGHGNLSVVGDDEQLIYAWRYANLKTFLDFEKDWPGARITFLEENYRSTANIIGAAAAVAQNNRYRRPKNLWTKNAPGSLIKIFEADDEDEEAEWIAGEIELRIMNNELGGGQKTIIRNSSFIIPTTAVLYRTNAQSRAVEQALIRHQIPYKIFGGLKFYERKEIKDIVAALRYFANRSDSVSRERLEKNFGKNRLADLETAFSNIEKNTMLSIGAIAQNDNMIEKNAASPTQLIEAVLETTDYLKYLERNFINYSERHENVGELIAFASRFDDLQGFLEEIALVQATDVPSGGKYNANDANSMRMPRIKNPNSQHSHTFVDSHYGQVVHLSTIHLAKGLEFDCVFIAGANEGLLPHAMSMDKDEQLEEERRLMYVAMTRAKKELCIGFYNLPSRFLSEIPEGLVEFQNLPDEDTEDSEEYINIE